MKLLDPMVILNKSFVQFLIMLFAFLLLNIRKSLYILNVNPLSNIL